LTGLLGGILVSGAFSSNAQERVDFSWQVRDSQGNVTRDLVINQPNTLIAYARKVNGTDNTVGIGIRYSMPEGVNLVNMIQPNYSTNYLDSWGLQDFFFDTERNRMALMNKGVNSISDQDINRIVALKNSVGNTIIQGNKDGEGIVGILEVMPTNYGEKTFRFKRADAANINGISQDNTKEDLSCLVVPALENRTLESGWRGSGLLTPKFKKDIYGIIAPEVYVSGSGKENDTVVLRIHDNFITEGVPVYTNKGGAFSYRDISWTNSPSRGYSTISYPAPEFEPSNALSNPEKPSN